MKHLKLKYFIINISIIVLFFISAKIGHTISFVGKNVTLIWLPSGVSFAALTIFGLRYFPAVAVGSFLSTFYTGVGVEFSIFTMIANTIEPIFSCYILNKYFKFTNFKNKLLDFRNFIFFAVIIAPIFSATIGTTGLIYNNIISIEGCFYVAIGWWVGNAMGVLLLAPLFLMIKTSKKRMRTKRFLEYLMTFSLVTFLSILIYMNNMNLDFLKSLSYAVFPLLIFAAFRYTFFHTFILCLTNSTLAILGTINRTGPFYFENINTSLFYLHAFIFITTINIMVLSAVISERNEFEEEMSKSEERFRKAIDRSPFPIMIHADDGTILSISDGFTYSSGYTIEDIPTIKEWTKKAYKDKYEFILDEINQLYKTNYKKEGRESKIISKTGHEIIWDFSSAPLGKLLDGRSAVISIAKDVTEMKLIENELRKEKEKAEKISKEKSEFIANMSHELRTPLNVNLGAIQLFELYIKNDSELNKDKISKHLKSMSQNCLRLLRLVNNLIDTTKIDAGFYEPNLSYQNIVYIIESIAMSVSDYANQKNINITFDTEIEELFINCDVDMIERIMLNLISNAIKFTKDSVDINIYHEEDKVIISVKDNGIGIKKDDQGKIFERYKQVDELFTRKNEGSGIGLALVESLVKIHGGSVIVKSDYGSGAEFIIKLPIAQDISGKFIQNSALYTDYNDKFIQKMNVEFSDIY